MMRIIIFCFFTLATYPLCAQSDPIDSLKTLLEMQPPDSIHVEVLLDLAFEYKNSAPDSTIYYAEKALTLSKEIKYVSGQAQAIRNIGLGYSKMGAYDTAIALCKQAIDIAVSHQLKNNEADAYNTIGIAHFFKGEYDHAIDAFQKTSEIYKILHREVDQAGALSNISSILEVKGDYPRAMEYYQRALLIFEKLDHQVGIATVSHNMASILEDQGEIRKAFDAYHRAARIDSVTNNLRGYAVTANSLAQLRLQLGDTLKGIEDFHHSITAYRMAGANCRTSAPMSNLGDLYLSMRKLDSAYTYISRAVAIAKNCDDIDNLIHSSIDFGKYYQITNNLSKAEAYFQQSYQLATKEDMKANIATAAEHLYQVYKKRKQTEQALKYLEIQKATEDAIFNKENTREIALLEAAYTLEKEKQAFEYERELDQVRHKEELEKEKVLQQVFLIALIIFLLLLLVIFWLYIQKAKVNKALDLKNREISQQNSQILEQNEEITLQRDLLEERSQLVESQKQELLRANNDLKNLNEEKDTIIGIVAHDLKSPINQIKGLIQLTRLKGEEGNVQTYLDKIENSSQRSIEMIDRILDISAIENRSIEVRTVSVDLPKLLKHLQEDFEIQAKSKDITITLNVEVTTLMIKTDRLLLIEIISNLLSNSIKFSPANSIVSLAIQKSEGQHVKVMVSDQGPGISEEDQKVMYNKYQRVSATPTAGEKSTGLGLAIVKRYVETLGYSLHCISAPGKGTTFVLEIPYIENTLS